MLLYHHAMESGIETIVPAYLALGRAMVTESIEQPLGEDDTTPGEIYSAVEPIIFKILGEIFNAGKDFIPTTELEDQCPGCPYASLCGTLWTNAHRKVF